MITIDEKGLAEAQKLLKYMPNAVPKAAARAINRAATAAKTEAWKQVKKEYTVKQTYVKRAWDKISKAFPGRLEAKLVSKGSVMALSYFTHRPKSVPKRRPKNPVYVQVRRDGGGRIAHAFLATMKSGHTGIFTRAGKSSYPIDQKYGPSVPQMLGNKTVSGFIEERATVVLNQRFEHEVQAILNGVAK